jgi:DNA polymerase-3 subunit beta
MKFICLRENLKEALMVCERVVGKSVALPILNNVLIEDDSGQIKISSTDLEMGINFWLSGKVVEKGRLTCPAKILANFVNNLSSQKIELESKDNILSVKSESSRCSIPGVSAEDFPIIPKVKNQDFINISSLFFKNSLGQVINCVAISETRPEISGIFLKTDPEGLKMAATDSFRLAEKKISEKNFKLKVEKLKDQGVIFPQKVAQELIRIIGDIERPLKIFIDPNQILFDLENTHLISRLIEGQYPNYQAIIPSKLATQVSILKEELLGAVKIAGIFSSKINDIKIKVLPQKSTLEIESQSEFGSNHTQIPAKIVGDQLEVVFNYRYLIDGLNNILAKEVILGLNNETSPVVLKAVNDPSYFYIAMPIKSG